MILWLIFWIDFLQNGIVKHNLLVSNSFEFWHPVSSQMLLTIDKKAGFNR